MIWILAIYLTVGGQQHLVGWSEYSNKAACEYAGTHRPPSKEIWRCLKQS